MLCSCSFLNHLFCFFIIDYLLGLRLGEQALARPEPGSSTDGLVVASSGTERVEERDERVRCWARRARVYWPKEENETKKLKSLARARRAPIYRAANWPRPCPCCRDDGRCVWGTTVVVFINCNPFNLPKEIISSMLNH